MFQLYLNKKILFSGYLDYYDRIVDVGWLGKWWILEKKMEDMDVNPEEWLPDGRPAHPENQFWKSAL